MIKLIFILNLISFSAFTATSGSISIDQRFFENDGVDTSNDRGFAISTNLRSDIDWKNLTFSGNIMGRIDDQDPTRNIFILQEAMLRYQFKYWGNSFELFAGFEKFNFGANEVFKPADNLNARNFDSDVENTEKYGELTFGLRRNFSWGDISLFALPGEEYHYIPGANSRLGVGIDVQQVSYVQNVDGEEYNEEVGVIINWYGDLGDVSFFYLSHLDKKLPIFGNRNYIFDPTETACGAQLCPADGTINTPYYYETKEYGVTSSLVFSDVILKLEAVSRNYNTSVDILTINGLERPENHTDVAIGAEYTQYLDSGAELRYLFEYAKVFDVEQDIATKRFIFQDDLYFGVHLTLNDPMDSKFNIGGIMDMSGKMRGYTLFLLTVG